MGLGEVAILPREDVLNGMGIHAVCICAGVTIEFDAYHLKKSVYETAAKEGGLSGEFTWQTIHLPPGETQVPELKRSEEYWHSYLAFPHFAILTLSKS